MNLNLFDILVIGAGLYMAYCSVMMKIKGQINSSVVLSRNVDENSLKDKEGFIGYIWWKLLAVGLLCAASGVFNLVYTSVAEVSDTYIFVQIGVNTFFFILLIVYGVVVVKAQKKYMK